MLRIVWTNGAQNSVGLLRVYKEGLAHERTVLSSGEWTKAEKTHHFLC
jgi:hypothetical protein